MTATALKFDLTDNMADCRNSLEMAVKKDILDRLLGRMDWQDFELNKDGTHVRFYWLDAIRTVRANAGNLKLLEDHGITLIPWPGRPYPAGYDYVKAKANGERILNNKAFRMLAKYPALATAMNHHEIEKMVEYVQTTV